MLILAIETSAVSASVALCNEEKTLAQVYQNNGHTHSETVLPMIRDVFATMKCSPKSVDVIAVANGPGSFTGLRIGLSTAKGLAWALNKPCAAVSTLEAMAASASVFEGIIVTAMDARRHQVYNANFISVAGKMTRLSEDRAVSLEQLAGELNALSGPKLVVGDGASLCYNYLNSAGLEGVFLAPENVRYQSAWGVAKVALEKATTGNLISHGALLPEYRRISQAEREYREKQRKNNFDRG